VAIGSLAASILVLLLSPVAPSWVRLIAAWMLVIALAQAAFTIVKTLPHVMFRRSREDQRLTPELRADFWNRQMSVDASEDGMTVTVGRRSASLKWSDVGRLTSDTRCHLLRVGASGYLLVPRRAFRTEKKDAAFCDLVASHAGKSPAAKERLGTPRAMMIPTPAGPLALAEAYTSELAEASVSSPVPSVGRNEPCPCGSGKKFKRCCLGTPR
jgi:hypothetical protein